MRATDVFTNQHIEPPATRRETGRFYNGSGRCKQQSKQFWNDRHARHSDGHRCSSGLCPLLAESVAQLPCELYRRTKDGGRERATDHALYDIVHSQPNKKDTSFEYYEQTQGVLGLEGNSFALIDRAGSGEITELIPVNPKKVIVMKGPDALPYYHLPDLGETLPMRMVHHIKYFSLDGYLGTSPIQTNADVLGLGLAVDKHAAQVFSHGTTMSGVIERPADVKAIASQDAVDRILSKWTERYSGIRNAFSVGMLQEGMTYKQLSQDNEKAQLLQSRQWTVNEICRLYKVPPHMIQLLDKSTNNNIEHQGLQYVMYTLLAWLKRHESAMMRDLLLPSERRDLYIEFNVSSLLRGTRSRVMSRMRWGGSGAGCRSMTSAGWRTCPRSPVATPI